ncbi:ABC transporter ATP-binding protein [Caminibacter pacificus]|uniref:ABC transport system ATP-binding protein n=1 Tax=Caminibacter pacificus TaxID=1424653 RepID=A0AAJ4RDM3_9BACT|nr:ABC transporter ATP-binding protein [Caminibacter pacificus]NPA87355.1 ABC transporter ATP-binding protein [Campylobacterota bacterium]QCI28443.1 ABC transporter ATP-binding protein [Caminibacter pacificus]ROR40832.1 putative ABC transport system ATP-binding protein [Caminibacter pacificus]
MVKLTNVHKSYKSGEIEVKVLEGLDLYIQKGEFVALIGPSGSGKTTILNIIGALDKADSGNVEVAGVDITNRDEKELTKFRADHLGYIFQDFNLIEVFSVFENVNFPLKVIHKRKDDEKVKALLEDIGMSDQINKFPDQLSGGQKQRVAVARALVSDPLIVLADEPTANLDSVTSHKVIELMRKMQREFNTTFIFSTHDTHLIDEVDRVLYLQDGKIIKDERK